MARPADVAARLGFSYRAKADKSFKQTFRDLPEVPRNATIRHVMEGDLDGRPLVAFQSAYMVWAGQTAVQVSATVYAAEAPPWPPLHVTPRGLVGRVAVRLGRRPRLELEDAEFNVRYKVRASDEDFAVALLSPEMQVFLLTNRRVRWRIAPRRVCMIYGGTLKAARIEASLERFRGFWTRIAAELAAW